MKKYIPFILFFLVLFPDLTSQTVKIDGKVLDSQTRYPLSEAEVIIDQKSSRTDNTGSFSIVHSAGKLKIQIKKVNLEEKVFEVDIKCDTSLTLLYDKVIKISEVTVSANRDKVFIRDENLEITRLSTANISFLPSVGSNEDLLKKVQLLPGFQSAGEGSSGLVVRGGQYDQNLITINGFPIYQLYHFSGFLSAIDPFLISDVEIMKGGFPAKYGGKLSSVVNFISDRSISDTSHISISAGIFISGVAARFSPDTLTSVNLSARIGTTSILKKLVQTSLPEFPFYNFYDINLGASRVINSRNVVSLTFFLNKDYLKKSTSLTINTSAGDTTAIADIAESGWKDFLGGISWGYQPRNDLKIETRVFYQDYKSDSYHEILEPLEHQSSVNETSSPIKELGITSHWGLMKEKHKLNFGICSYLRQVAPHVTTTVLINDEPINEGLNPQIVEKADLQFELSPYVEDQFNLTKNTIVRPGIRFLLLSGSNKTIFRPEPRFYISHKLSDFITFMGSYVVTSQSIQLISSSNIMSTSDLWIPAGGSVKPAVSGMGELGIYLNNGKSITSEINVYYKSMKNLYNYKDGASFLFNPRWQDNIALAKGKSYGVEFLIQGNLKKSFFMLAYTLSKTTRISPEINDGKEFNYKYDRPHNLNVTIGYKPSGKFNLSCNWVFQSGILNTFETRVYQRDMIYMYYQPPYIDGINNIRFPNYHRLDLGCEYIKPLKWGKFIIKMDIYNVYSKLNPWFIEALNTYGMQEIWQITLFPILPSLSLKVEF
jgi:hypothetical protein